MIKKAFKKKKTALKTLLVIFFAVILTTMAIKASDDFFSKEDGDDGCEKGMAYVPTSDGGFCIDVYENSAGEKCAYANPANQLESRENFNSIDCRPESVAGKTPWRNISQNQAAAACAKAGKRLPTSKEWGLASLGTPDILSGWGSDDCQVAKNWNDQPGLTGSAKNCLSGQGVYDMVGNVWEWTDGNVVDGAYHGQDLPKEGYVSGMDENGWPIKTQDDQDENYNGDYFWIKSKGTRGIARGGYWDNRSGAGVNSAYIVIEPSFAGEGIGFRCAK